MVTKKKIELNIESIKPRIVPILIKHHVSRAAIFGSVAMGKANQSSDVDLLVEFEGEKSLLDLVALKMDLEDAIEHKVDVQTYAALHPLIKKAVLAQEVRVL